MTATILLILVLLTAHTAHAARKPASEQAWQYRWQVWLPPHWKRLGQCETHLDWRFNNGTYEGAFAFYRGSWDAFRPSYYPSSASSSTPWQQFVVARKIAARYGIASPWGCWRGSSHAWVRGNKPEHGVYK